MERRTSERSSFRGKERPGGVSIRVREGSSRVVVQRKRAQRHGEKKEKAFERQRGTTREKGGEWRGGGKRGGEGERSDKKGKTTLHKNDKKAIRAGGRESIKGGKQVNKQRRSVKERKSQEKPAQGKVGNQGGGGLGGKHDPGRRPGGERIEKSLCQN